MLRDKLLAHLAAERQTPDYQRLAADVLGIRGATPALARTLVEQALVMEDRREQWRRVGEHAVREAPAGPGVYVFRDWAGCALYVGKAVHLRRRLRAHFAHRRWRALPPAMARVAAVEWHRVGSEIEALIVEAVLIGDLQPLVNVQTAAPALDTRAIPRSLVRDVVLLVPSIVPRCGRNRRRTSRRRHAAAANAAKRRRACPPLRTGVDLLSSAVVRDGADKRLWCFRGSRAVGSARLASIRATRNGRGAPRAAGTVADGQGPVFRSTRCPPPNRLRRGNQDGIFRGISWFSPAMSMPPNLQFGASPEQVDPRRRHPRPSIVCRPQSGRRPS